MIHYVNLVGLQIHTYNRTKIEVYTASGNKICEELLAKNQQIYIHAVLGNTTETQGYSILVINGI